MGKLINFEKSCLRPNLGKDETGQRMEALEIPEKKYYVAVQFHPEYLSRPLRPSPPYVGLLAAASGQLERFASDAKQRNARKAVPSTPVHNSDDDKNVHQDDVEYQSDSLFA